MLDNPTVAVMMPLTSSNEVVFATTNDEVVPQQGLVLCNGRSGSYKESGQPKAAWFSENQILKEAL